jgi:hypothetical protein
MAAGGRSANNSRMQLPTFDSFFGVDFSGGRLAGRNVWVARCVPAGEPCPVRGWLNPHNRPLTGHGSPDRLTLVSLDRLEALAGTADRTPALAHLVQLVRSSSTALWGFDFPFGLPVELFPVGHRWPAVFEFLNEWEEDAYGCGLECVRRARKLKHAEARKTANHVRRVTDVEAKAPFDTFHYRIIYQTFFGIRDVIGPLSRTPRTAVLPFQYRKLPTAERVLVECCPSSVLKALGLPHQNYKQPTGGPLTRRRKLTRHRLLAAVEQFVDIPPRFRRVMMRNPGGDAMDAVIAAVGAWRAVLSADHTAIAKHPRYRHEGRLYV